MTENIITTDQLLLLVDPKSISTLNEYGGVEGLAQKLSSSLEKGLSPETVVKHREIYGTNILPEPVQKRFYEFVLEAFNDKTLMVLIAAAFVELALGIYKFKFAPPKDQDQAALLDGIAVLAAGKFSL